MQYKQFLWWGGISLLAVGLLGFVGLGPTPDSSLLGGWLYFDVNQSLIHLVFGLLAMLAVKFDYEPVYRYFTALIGVIGVSLAAYSIYRINAPTPNIFILNIETPLESFVYLVFGLCALWVVLMPPGPLFVKEESRQ